MTAYRAGYLTEADLQRTVLDFCRVLRLRVAHFRTAQVRPGRYATPVSGDGAGFPDLVIAGRVVLFRELKAHRGRLSAEQELWLTTLTHAGANVSVWRPGDLTSGLIERELKEAA